MSESYSSQQEKFLENLALEIGSFTILMGATKVEIANALGISRQSLYVFLEDNSKGLPLSWSKAFNLWSSITNPPASVTSRLTPEQIMLRRQLKVAGPDRFLNSIGFIGVRGISQFDFGENSSLGNHDLIFRLATRLNSSFLVNERVKSKIINKAINDISEAQTDKQPSSYSNLDEVKKWAHSFPGVISNKVVFEQFILRVSSYFADGKKQFNKRELYELYFSIHESSCIDISFHKRIKLVDIQSKIISIPSFIDDPDYKESGFNAELELLGLATIDCKSCEGLLLKSLHEVSISCEVDLNNNGSKVFVWKSCSASEIDAILIGIRKGLGFEFEVQNINVVNLNTNNKSLYKCEISLSDEKGGVYYGWWVDCDIRRCVVCSALTAGEKWLAGKDLNTDAHTQYQYIFEQANLNEVAFLSRSAFYTSKNSIKDFLYQKADKIISRIEDQVVLDEASCGITKTIANEINDKRLLMLCTRLHSLILEGDLLRASNIVASFEFDKFVEDPNITEVNKINLISCCWLFDLTISDFNNSNNQYGTLADCRRLIQEKINRENNIDYDSYLYSSQVWGGDALLRFYSNKNLQPEIIDQFFRAGYFAFKIGHFKRGVHWLSYAGRAMVKMGRGEQAKGLVASLLTEISRSNRVWSLGDLSPILNQGRFGEKFNDLLDVFGLQNFNNLDLKTIELSFDNDWSTASFSLFFAELLSPYEDKSLGSVEIFSLVEVCLINSIKSSLSTGFARMAIESLFKTVQFAKNNKFNFKKLKLLSQNSNIDFKRNCFFISCEKVLLLLGDNYEGNIGLLEKLIIATVESWSKGYEIDFDSFNFEQFSIEGSFLAGIN